MGTEVKKTVELENFIKDWAVLPSKKKRIIHLYFLMNYPKGPR